MGVKRIRPWDYCDNIEELKRMLNEKDEQLQRVVTEKDIQLAALERKLKSTKKHADSSPAGADGGPSKAFTPKQLETQVNKLRRSIQSLVLNQMAYKPSTKHGSAKLVPVEIFDVEETVLKALFGETLMKEAASGPKQLKLIATNEEVEMIFNRSLSKSLRFGATLELTKGLNFVYQKEGGALRLLAVMVWLSETKHLEKKLGSFVIDICNLKDETIFGDQDGVYSLNIYFFTLYDYQIYHSV